MEFQKILVAIDRSNFASLIFEKALNLAQKDKASLTIFHCINEEMVEPPTKFEMGFGLSATGSEIFRPVRQEVIGTETQEIKAWLNGYSQQAIDLGVITQSDYQFGSPGSSIIKSAKEWDADLIMIGRENHNQLAEFLMGSVSNYVVHHANCSVLVVRDYKSVNKDKNQELGVNNS